MNKCLYCGKSIIRNNYCDYYCQYKHDHKMIENKKEEILGNTNPKVGEIWESDPSENPFDEKLYQVILEIDGDYYKYTYCYKVRDYFVLPRFQFPSSIDQLERRFHRFARNFEEFKRKFNMLSTKEKENNTSTQFNNIGKRQIEP